MNRRGVVKWMAAGGAVVVAAAGAICAQAAYSDQTLKAMHDEAMRSLTLAVASLEKPYFVEYVLDQEEVFTVSATLGGLMVRNREQLREPEVHVRVGDYKFDNGNFAGAGFGGRFRGHLPLEGSYDLARRYFWLATDAAYKGAVEGDCAQAGGVAECLRERRSAGRFRPRSSFRARCANWAICRSTRTPGRRGCAAFPRCSRATPR